MIRRAALWLSLGLAMSTTALAAPGSPTHFTRDPALLKATEQKLVDAMRAQNPQAAAALDKLFAQDIIAELQPSFRQTGLDSDDVADMMTTYWVNAWEGANGIVGRKPDPVLVGAAQKQVAGIMSRNATMGQMSDAQKQEVADTMLIQALLIEGRMNAAAKQGPDAVRRMSDTIAQEAQATVKTDMRAVTLTAEGFRPKGSASAATPRGAPSPASPSSSAAGLPTGPVGHADNWKNVEGVYFKSAFTFGVGGMMVQNFQPVVLFRDGSYYRVEGPALEDLDLAAERTARPARWGRWQKAAGGYVLVDDNGKPSKPLPLQGGQFFKAFAAEAGGNRLSAHYTRVSGGGNTALGGTAMVFSQTDLSFAPDGRYMRKGAGGGSNSGGGVGVSAYANNANGGRYQIRNYTISMTQPDGSTKRQFFAFGSQHNPAAIDPEMMFLGANVFTVLH